MGDESKGDNVVAFPGTYVGTVKPGTPECRWHARFTVDVDSRETRCATCGKMVEPFDVLARIVKTDEATRERQRRYKKDIGERIEALRVEETRTKARVKSLRRKDAADAVRDAVTHWQTKYERVAYRLEEIERSAATCRRMLGDAGRPVPEEKP